MTGVLSCGATAPGTRRITASFLAARLAVDEVEGLPEDINHLKLLDLLRRARLVLGLDERQLGYLEYLIRKTHRCDWEEGQRPIVWQSVSASALDRGVTSRTIRNIEARLNKLGLIGWNDSGNHRRSGYRGEDGYILEAWGVDLSPLGAEIERIREAAEEAAAIREDWRREKRKWGAESRAVKRLLVHLGRIDSEPELVRARISEILPLKDLREKVREITELRIELETEAAALEGVVAAGAAGDPGVDETPPDAVPGSPDSLPDTGPGPVGATEGETRGKPCGRVPGISATGDAAFRHIQPTESKPESYGYMYGRQGEERRWIDCGLEHIDPSSLQHLASQAVSERLPHDRPADWRDVWRCGTGLRGHLGINRRLWDEGCRLIGPVGMAVLLAIAAARHEDRGGCDGMILNPGGWVRGCLRKAAIGELRLHGSVYGLLGERGVGRA